MDLLYIITSILYFIDVVMIIKNIENKAIPLKKIWVTFTIVLLLSIGISPLKENYFLLLFIPVFLIKILSLKLCMKQVRLSTIIYTYFICVSVTSIMSACILIIFDFNQSYTSLLDLIINIIATISIIVICKTKLKHIFESLYSYVPKIAKYLIAFIFLLNMCLSILLIDFVYYDNIPTWYNFIKRFTVLIILTTILMIFYLLYATISNTRLKQLTENYEKQINIQSEHYKKLAAANVDVRRFKHDFKNMSIAIEKLLSDGNTEEALNLLKSSVNSFDSHDNTINPFKSGNPIADALLADKQKMAHSAGATIEFEGAIPAELLSPTDICVLLGNTLDNAIEACQKFPHNIHKTIRISANCVGSIAFIMIENPVTEKANIKNNHIKTSKENKTLHGFGLYSLNSIVKKYSGTLKISSTDSKFTVEISLFFNNRTKN